MNNLSLMQIRFFFYLMYICFLISKRKRTKGKHGGCL